MSEYNMLVNLQSHYKQFVIDSFGPRGPFKQAKVWLLSFIDVRCSVWAKRQGPWAQGDLSVHQRSLRTLNNSQHTLGI